MPDPIKVDFRKRRPAKKPLAAAKPRPPQNSGQKAINWRAMPRFLLFMLAMALFFAAVNWIGKLIS